MTQEVHEFSQCFPKKLRHQAKLSTPASRNKFHVWGWAKRQNTSRYTKSFMICRSSLLQILRDFVTQKCRSHACICVNNVYFYRSIRYCCELKLETASSASALTTATRCISQEYILPTSKQQTNYSAPSWANFDLTQQTLSYYHFAKIQHNLNR